MLRAYLFTLRASSFVTHPPVSFEGFFTFLCSLLFWEQVMGASCSIPESVSGRAQQEFFPTAHNVLSLSYTPEIFL